uniref:50S ribosomal protein L18 n=1 Tax=Zea mays TaxID=4577 RepID=A0A804LED3_MAIZE
MALLRAALAQPLSPRPALPVRHPPTSLTGSRFILDFSLPPHPGPGAPRREYPRIEATARRGARTESAKVRNRRLQKKFNGTATKPRLSVFCSNRQLYAVLADDHNKKILFYGSTLQKSICGDPPCGTVVSRRRRLLHLEFGLYSGGTLELEFASPARPAQEAARKVGEELVRVCNELGISEVSYDRNGFARGDKMMAFEVPVSQHGFLPR